MADNITAPAVGAVLATDDIGGVHYPRTKISFGAEGAATDVSSAAPFPVAIISGGGGGGGDASAANQDEQTALLTTIDASLAAPLAVTGAFYPTTQPVSLASPVAVTGTFYQATQPVSIASPVAVTGTFFQATQPVSAAALPLPSGASTAANQTTAISAIATIGTRAYGAGQQVAIGAASAASTGLAATEVLLHASARCFIRVATAATSAAGIPLEAGEKFHLRLTSGQQIHVIRDTEDGSLNIVPVA